MAASLLATLTAAGVLERSGRRRAVLRVTPRFLAYAEGTAGRLRTLGVEADPLEAALATWDGYHAEASGGARVLRAFLQDHDQGGHLQPVFPAIESFAVAA